MLKEYISPKVIFYLVTSLFIIFIVGKSANYILDLKKDKDRLFTELIGQKEVYKQLSDYAAKLEINYNNQVDLKRKAEQEFSDERLALRDHIKVLSDATYLIKEKSRSEKNSDVVYSEPGKTSWVLNEIRMSPDKYGNPGPALGYVLIFGDGRVTSKVYNHEIIVKEVISKDENSGQYSVVSKADYILKAQSLSLVGTSWVNKPYPLNIIEGTAFIDPTEPSLLKKHFIWWDPKINLNADVDQNGVVPGVGLSLMGYGRTQDDLDFKFAQFGLDIEGTTPRAMFTPALWRPLDGFISNTYIGPGVSLSPTKAVGYFVGIQVGL